MAASGARRDEEAALTVHRGNTLHASPYAGVELHGLNQPTGWLSSIGARQVQDVVKRLDRRQLGISALFI